MLTKLSSFAHNAFSQFGEDGITKKIFEIIGKDTMRCCEFGAVDGFTLSNTAYLFTNAWQAILIEGKKEEYEKMVVKVKEYNCTPLNYYVGIDHNKDSLDFIFDKEKINPKLDLLSIDIDGNDYYILDSLTKIDANVIICEYNPTIPYYMDIYADYGNTFGSSVAALTRIAENKGYFLACLTDANCFFVKNKFKWLFQDYELDIHRIASNKYLKYIITNYNGDYMILGDLSACYGLKNLLKENINGQNIRVNPNTLITTGENK